MRKGRAHRPCAKVVRNSTRSVWRTLVRLFRCAMGARFSRGCGLGSKAGLKMSDAERIRTVRSHSGAS